MTDQRRQPELGDGPDESPCQRFMHMRMIPSVLILDSDYGTVTLLITPQSLAYTSMLTIHQRADFSPVTGHLGTLYFNPLRCTTVSVLSSVLGGNMAGRGCCGSAIDGDRMSLKPLLVS